MIRALAVACLCASALADTVVLRDRTVLAGAANRAGDVVDIAGRKVPVGEVLLWEDDAGLLKLETPLFGQVEGYRILADRAALAKCLDLLPKAAEGGAGRSARARSTSSSVR